jgi:ferric-dicitrate binding protein FerR (iron transport regulator)
MVEGPFSPREPEGDVVARLLRLAGPRPAVSAERVARVKGAAREAWQRSVARERQRRRTLVVATLLAAAGLAFVFLRPARRPEPSPPAPVVAVVDIARGSGAGTGPSPGRLAVGAAVRAGEAIATPPGGRLSLRLVSGASLRIDGSTRLRLESPVELTLEEGGVYVDSGGAGRGPRIATPLGTVTDAGTQFETRLRSDRLRVRVREGRVSVAGPGAEQTAAAGEELTVDRSGAMHRASVPVTGPDWSWALGLSPGFEVDGQTLAAFLESLGRETHWRFRFSPKGLEARTARIVLHGSLAGLAPEEALEAALATSGLRAERRPDGFVIERATGPDPEPSTTP